MDWNSATTKKHIKEAEAVGLTLIGDGKKVGFRIYSFNKCGHKAQKQIRLVRTKQIRCNDCLQD